mgnify:FL=1
MDTIFKIDNINCTALTTIDIVSIFVKNPSKNTPTYGGVKVEHFIIPKYIAHPPNEPIIPPQITNGIKNIGFNTIGAPNRIGSLIPNNAGINDNLPTCF